MRHSGEIEYTESKTEQEDPMALGGIAVAGDANPQERTSNHTATDISSGVHNAGTVPSSDAVLCSFPCVIQ